MTKPSTSGASAERIVMTVSGRDKPGIMSSLFRTIANNNCIVQDVNQMVMQGYLTAVITIELASGSMQVVKDLLFHANEQGMKMDFNVLTKDPSAARAAASDELYAITIISQEIKAAMIAEIADMLNRKQITIDKISPLSERRLSSLEFTVRVPQSIKLDEFKAELLQLARAQKTDVAVQREGLHRRSKRLVVMDVSNTLVQGDMLLELARAAGKLDAVRALKQSATAQNLEEGRPAAGAAGAAGRESGACVCVLKKCVAMLAGMKEEALRQVVAGMKYTDGARQLCYALRRLGYKLAVISTGFSTMIEHFKKDLGLDYTFSNVLEIEQGHLTGRLVGQIINGQRKVEIMQLIAQQEQIELEQVIAIGDGANSVDMIRSAGLGICFNDIPTYQLAAKAAINQTNVDAVLYLLGISDRDLRTLTADEAGTPSKP
eukprot:tig00000970_g5824.t1